MTDRMKMTVTEEDVMTRVSGDATERTDVTSAREHLQDADDGAILRTETAVLPASTSAGLVLSIEQDTAVFSSCSGFGQTAKRILTVSVTTVVLCSILW